MSIEDTADYAESLRRASYRSSNDDVIRYSASIERSPIPRDSLSAQTTDWIIKSHSNNLISKLNNTAAPLRQIPVPRQEKRSNDEESNSSMKNEKGIKEKETVDARYQISFPELQRMRLRKLQCELVRHTIDLRLNGKDGESWKNSDEEDGWENVLKQYVEAVRDYDYMTECSKRRRDPFLATGEYYTDHLAMKKIVNLTGLQERFQAQTGSFPTVDSMEPWEDENDKKEYIAMLGTRRAYVNILATKAFYRRLIIALLAGGFLLGPMWLMAMHRTLYTALVGTSVAVILFGLGMSCFLEKEADVMMGTAAYAAVLVVFVGLRLEAVDGKS